MALEPLPAEVPERTVRELLLRNVAERPDKTALIAPSHMAGEARFTWSELAERSAALAGAMLERRLKPDDRVAQLIDSADAAESHITYHAAHQLGAINLPLNTRYVDRELAWVFQFTQPRALIFSPRFAPVIERVRESLPAEAVLLACGESFEESCESRVQAPEPTLRVEDDADWIFTSGTTGNPKAVALSHANSVACGYQARRLWGIGPGSVYQSFAPLFHEHRVSHQPARLPRRRLCVCRRAGVRRARDAAPDRTQPDNLNLPDLGRHPADAGPARPRQATARARSELAAADRLRRSGDVSALLPARVLEVFELRLGIELVHLWGLTEGGTSGTLLPPSLHGEGVRCAGDYGLSIGTEGFNEWVRFRVVGDDGEDTVPNEVGELCLRGPSVMDRYVNEPEATGEALRDGWLHTGDMGLIDEAGFLYFVDRRKHMIRRGGLNISSVEVQAGIMEHPAVREVSVVPRLNPILEQDVKAIVIVADGREVSAEEIIAFCRERLADYKVPAEVVFIDALPRNAMNRVVKGELEVAST